MREDWRGTYRRDQSRAVAILCFPGLSWRELVEGERHPYPWERWRAYATGDVVTASDGTEFVATAPSLGVDPAVDPGISWAEADPESDFALPAPVDYTAFVEAASHSASELRLAMALATSTATVPAPGDLLCVRDTATGQDLFRAQVVGHDGISEQRGQLRLTVIARGRDAADAWRQTRWSTMNYPAGTELAIPVEDVLRSLGMVQQEYTSLQPFGRWTPHTTTQLGDMTAWEMLEALLVPVLLEPWIDAVGRFRPVSRDVRRDANIVLSDEDVLRVSRLVPEAPTTSVIVPWLGHELVESSQQSQVVGQGNITAGFFQLKQHLRIYWSADRRQRAKNTHMRVLESANSGLIGFCKERYEQIDEFHGRITCETSDQVPAIILNCVTSMLYAQGVGDLVSGGQTMRLGTLIDNVCSLIMWAIFQEIGTGTYEVWGEPYDYIYTVNRSEAYIPTARQWQQKQETIESDLIFDEAHAQQVAVAELAYRHLAAGTMTAEVVDDPRIERGDIVRLRDGLRLYVVDYARDLARGRPATLTLQGFRV